MAIWWDSPVPPDAQTAFIRQVPIPANNTLLQLFGRQTSDDNTVDFSEIVQTNRIARYRSYDGRIHVSERDGGSGKRVRIMPLSTSLNESEFERVQREIQRNRGTNFARLEQAIYNDSTRLTREVLNRLELAWGDTLSDGILTISEGGIGGTAGTADYGVPANQKTTVGVSWASFGTSTVISDLQAALDIYITANGFPPGSILTSDLTQRRMRQSNEVVDMVYGTADTRTRVRQDDLTNLLATELRGLQLREAYDASFDVDGVTTRTIPDDKVILLPPNLDDLGSTVWGVSATALELVDSSQSDLSFEEAPGIVGVVEKVGPPYRSFTFVDGTAMPVLTGAKLLSVIDTVP
jgi:hypothetical protein